MEDILSTIKEYATLYGLKVIGAILIFIIGRFIIGALVKMVAKLLDKSDVDPILSKFLLSLTRVALLTFLIIAVIGTLGVQTTSFVAILGAAGLAVGFALQGSLANLASGVMIIIFRPFKVGDFVEAGGSTGVIEEVRIFSTIMRTPDNIKVIIPNAQVTSGTISNYSANDTRRVDMVFGIGYEDNIKKAKEILERVVKEDSRVLKDPAVTVAVSELADSSVNFVVRPWVKTSDYWGVYFDITEKVKLTFDKEGISIPFPQRDVHLYNENK